MARWERMEGSSSVRGEGGVKRDTHRRREGLSLDENATSREAIRANPVGYQEGGGGGAAERPFVHVGWFGMPKQSWRQGRGRQGNLMFMVLLMVAVPDSRV